MSVDNFIPELWEGRLYETLRKSLVFGGLCNRNWEQKLLVAGDRVKITELGPITIRDYVKNVTTLTRQTLNDAGQWLDITQSKYFDFEVDDIDKAQAAGEILSDAADLASYGFADTFDQFVALLYAQAGSITVATPINSLNVYDALLGLGQALSDAKVPKIGRWCVIPPWFNRKLSLAEVQIENIQGEAWASGVVGRCAGFDQVFESNNVYETGGQYKIMAGTNRAMTVADQINKVEAYRPEGSFSDAMKGLHVYGGKVIDPACLAVLDASVLAEP